MNASIRALLPQILRWGQSSHPRIFISYRRHGEGAGYGGRIADNIVEKFGADQCFRDVADIESGVDFVKTIKDAVSACEILLAVVGPDWTSQASSQGGRRLDNPKDFVRLEVSAALERDIRVIPVLVGGAVMPTESDLPAPLQGLARRQAHELSDTRWDYDVERLLHTIESIGIRPVSAAKQTSVRKWKAVAASVAGVATLGAVLLGAASLLEDNDYTPSPWVQPVIDGGNSVEPPPQANPSNDNLADERSARMDAEASAALTMIRNLELGQQKKDADARAEQERSRRYDLEDALKDAQVRADLAAQEKRELDQYRQTNQPASVNAIFDRIKAAAANQEEAFNGIYGKSRVTWQHEGVTYDATVMLSGPRGAALVEYLDPSIGLPVGVEQDLVLLKNSNGAFYVGSSPRIAGTGIPALFYAPDIFKLAQTGQGWTISDVGDQWDHLDKATVR